jgi:hypothetical protein
VRVARINLVFWIIWALLWVFRIDMEPVPKHDASFYDDLAFDPVDTGETWERGGAAGDTRGSGLGFREPGE